MDDFGDIIDPTRYRVDVMVMLWRIMYFHGMTWEGDVILQIEIDLLENVL